MPRRRRERTESAAKQRQRAERARRAEEQFGRALRGLARRCGELTRQMYDENDPIGSSAKIRKVLADYAQTLRPWARSVAERMVRDVQRRDDKFWAEQAKGMARSLKEEIARSPIGRALRERTLEAAALITSLPLEAAQRVEKLSVEMLVDSSRSSELAKEILATGQVTKSRANLIARTETSRTAGILLQTRAETIGSEGYIWRTVEDIDVRKQHKKLAGRFFRWDSPPVAGTNGMRYHPGNGPNCRCYAEVVVPEYVAEAV